MDNLKSFKDILITCICGKSFVWTAGEQRFLQNLIDDGKTNRDGSPISFTRPKRCLECRLKKKEEYRRRENHSQDDY